MLKGERCLSPKCAVVRRSYAPGEHGQGFRGKVSQYGKQLREKQKAKRIYGIDEGQFARYVTEAEKYVGNRSEGLMQLLEMRLDNVIYRLGFASSRAQARQYASHGLFTVNGKSVTIPSFQLKVDDVVTPKVTKLFKELPLNQANIWLEADSKKLSGKVLHRPSREEIDTPINESLIIEFYSR